jgi:transposase
MKTEFKNFIGVDISKNTLDIFLLKSDGEIQILLIKNNKDCILKNFTQIFKTHDLSKQNTLICAEHTGFYGNILSDIMKTESYEFWLADPYTIKHSQGITRGKNDKIDAERIALFASRNYADRVDNQIDEEYFRSLEYLQGEKESYINDRAKYKGQLKDQEPFYSKTLFEDKKKRILRAITILNKNIKEIERKILQLIKEKPEIKRQYELILTVKGVGPQTALDTVIATKGFVKFQSPRAFTCHAGCAPFEYKSGVSVNSRKKVSLRADKNLKKRYHMAALSAIRATGELQTYFVRKVSEGKSKMSVLNAIRAKLIHRVFAVVQNNRKYEKNYIRNVA